MLNLVRSEACFLDQASQCKDPENGNESCTGAALGRGLVDGIS
ncbi:MAG: hypothetical protein OXE52_00065 [Chloroflexi bacterium]|nr:hypothetical protein [Chloroflexota bacterium]